MISSTYILAFFTFLVGCTTVKSYVAPDEMYKNLELSQDLFKQFISEHQKQYTDEEAEYRFQVFQENLKKIDQLNEEHESAIFGLTPFADMTPEEFKARVSCVFNVTDAEPAEIPNIEVPPTLDYREQNLVTEVKDQGRCGSCFIFGAIADIEGQYAKQHNQLISLSEQYPLDCGFSCNGGWPDAVANWLSKESGAVTTQSYPYEGHQGKCRKMSPGLVKVNCGKRYKGRSVKHIKRMLAKHGPLATVIFASPSIHLYKGGPITPKDCRHAFQFDHVVTIVGYSESYWIVKNSWGSSWGDRGYLLLNFDSQCSLGKILFPTTVV